MRLPQHETTGRTSAVVEPETVSPYLHDRGVSVYNPLTGAELAKDSEAWRALG